MTSRATELAKKAAAPVLLSLLAVFIFLSAFQKQHWDTDIFWALKSGEWILHNLKVPDTDPFSYTFFGKPWVDFTWGFQVLAHLFFTYLGGWAGLFTLQIIVVTLTFLFIYLNLRLVTSNKVSLAVLFLFIAYAGSYGRLFIRPHLFEYFFISLYLFLLNSYDRSGKPFFLYMLLPLQALWVNIHSSQILGIFLAGAYAGGEVLDEFRRNGFRLRMDLSPKAVKLIAVAALLPVAALINPYGLKLVIFPFMHQYGDTSDALRHISEWSRPPFKELFFFLYPVPLEFFAFKLAFYLAAISVLMNLKRLKARDLVLLAAALYLATSHIRLVSHFVFFAVPLTAANLSALIDRGRIIKGLDPAAITASLLMVVMLLMDFFSAGGREDRGIGVKRGVYPEATVRFLKEKKIEGKIFNEYIFGGYLIYNDVKVFIDGRTPTVYSPYFFWEMRRAGDPAGLKRLSGEYGIDIALIKPSGSVCKNLKTDPDWAAVGFDDVSVLFLKRTEAFREIIPEWGLTQVNPCADEKKYELPKDTEALKAFRDELRKMTGFQPYNEAAKPHRLIALADMELKGEFLNEAVAELRTYLQYDNDPLVWHDLGVALSKLKKYPDALDAFRKAIKFNEGFKPGYLGLGLAYYDMKDYGKAIDTLTKYTEMSADGSDRLAYKTLGFAYMKTGEFPSAVTNLKKAAFTTDDAKELGELYYNIGNALSESGDLKGAALHYGKAMENNPEYSIVLRELASGFERAGYKAKAQAILEIKGVSNPPPAE